VRAEEGQDAPAGVLGGRLVVAHPWNEPCHHSEEGRHLIPGAFVVVDELVPGLWVLLHVMLDPGGGQRPFQACGRSSQRRVPAAVTPDDGAGLGEELGGVGLLRGATVVDARRGEPTVGGQQQGQPAAHAVADDTDLPCAVLPGRQPRARRLDVGEHTAPPGARLAHDRDHAAQRPPVVHQVRRDGQVPVAGQPVGLVPQVLAHPERVMDNHDPRPRARPVRCRQVGRAAARPGDH
jgi:hypothetical protein